ncbi:alpha/beta hydrolase [Pseudomonas chlororaphis]|uniref:alpha/beta hydrolase n=1 Tax=Pseudomonas chlororaphis TaxID=587753 RepID=UPI0006A592E1|nr:alpha/beta hydrolase [Pseudomonas chlororaphis]AZD05108.1 Lysophospholipase [Pseudomonas chlororaphis subsp. chlororaphis]MBM0283800.1 alpha/beta hydrolase [Pseudomonas chlororaphis]MDO1507569.1 alpha/beta hydrolase [Pseudomonas chlororaphis]ORM47585.1 alpha/beta hydrolase [Pseudomonas chlororaphis subsp. chlororaphis]TWR90518.1 alpha/beta hydrolase [Pseudomonas chlororaphis subsp. chlororaphis]
MSATFDPDLLRASLRPLAEAQPLSAQAQAYQRFYGLDLPVKRGLGRFAVDGFEVVGQVWWPEQPVATLFLLHGFYDHMGLYRHVIEWALQRQWVVIACDLPGHGLSSGERASIDDFAVYQAVLQGLFDEARSLDLPQPWHLCGQSTGGAIVIDHLLNQGTQSPAQGQVILLSPLVRPRAWGWSKLSYYMLRPFVKGIARRFSENSTDPDFLPFLQRDPLQPLRLPTAWVGALAQWIKRIELAPRSSRQPLIVQGQADMTVDWQHNLQVIRQKFQQPQVLMLPEARHHLANEAACIRQEYFAFLNQHL